MCCWRPAQGSAPSAAPGALPRPPASAAPAPRGSLDWKERARSPDRSRRGGCATPPRVAARRNNLDTMEAPWPDGATHEAKAGAAQPEVPGLQHDPCFEHDYGEAAAEKATPRDARMSSQPPGYADMVQAAVADAVADMGPAGHNWLGADPGSWLGADPSAGHGAYGGRGTITADDGRGGACSAPSSPARKRAEDPTPGFLPRSAFSMDAAADSGAQSTQPLAVPNPPAEPFHQATATAAATAATATAAALQLLRPPPGCRLSCRSGTTRRPRPPRWRRRAPPSRGLSRAGSSPRSPRCSRTTRLRSAQRACDEAVAAGLTAEAGRAHSCHCPGPGHCSARRRPPRR